MSLPDPLTWSSHSVESGQQFAWRCCRNRGLYTHVQSSGLS